jgi:signal transduction histidine kinase
MKCSCVGSGCLSSGPRTLVFHLLALAIGCFAFLSPEALPVSLLETASLNIGFGILCFVAAASVVGPFTGGNEAEWTRYLEKLLKSERDRFMAMLDSMEEGVVIIGSDRKIRFANPAMIRQFGEGTNLHCYRYLHGFDEPCGEICRLLEVLRGDTERIEHNFTDGRTYDVICSPFADTDQSPCMLATFRNVTQRKQVELELIKINQLKTDLLSNVSHEMKSPLTSVKGIISSLLQEDIKWDDEARKMLLTGLSEETDRLSSLVTNLLNMSKLEAGVWGPEKEICSPAELMAETLERQKWIHQKHSFEADFEPNLRDVMADSNQIKQVLINLLENAVAYSEEGTTVSVAVREVDSEVEFSVSDQGVGIPAEELDRVFEKFYRGSQKRRRPGGTGLGLAICQAIVLAHGGRIWAESELGHGSTFRFRLPANEAQGRFRNEQNAKKAEGTGR